MTTEFLPNLAAWRETPSTTVQILVCVGLWGATLVLGDACLDWAAGSSYAIWDGDIWVLVTSAYVHLNVIHLYFNTWWLSELGRPLERALGGPRTILLTFASAFVSSAWQLGTSESAGIGFSGVIYAWAGFMWATRDHHPEFAPIFRRSTFGWLVAWALLCVFLTEAGPIRIGNAAHFSGLAFGLAVGGLGKLRWRRVGQLATATLTVSALVMPFWAPWNAEWLAYRASRHFDTNLVDAASWARRTLELDPDHCGARWIRGYAAHDAGHLGPAMADYDAVVAAQPEFAEARIQRGVLLLHAGEAGRALEDARVAQRVTPDDVRAHNLAGRARTFLEDLDAALVDYDRAIELLPDFPDARINRCWLHLTRGEPELALADCELAQRLAPGSRNARLGRAEAFRHSGRFADASAAYGELVEEGADDRDLWNGYGVSLFAEGEMARAAMACRQSIAAAGGTETARRPFLLLGLVDYTLGDLDGSLDALRKASATPEDRTYATIWMRWLHGVTAAPDEAVNGWPGELYRHAVGFIDGNELERRASEAETDWEARKHLCEAHTFVGLEAERRGDLEGAREHYRMALEQEAFNYLQDSFARWRLAQLRAGRTQR